MARSVRFLYLEMVWNGHFKCSLLCQPMSAISNWGYPPKLRLWLERWQAPGFHWVPRYWREASNGRPTRIKLDPSFSELGLVDNDMKWWGFDEGLTMRCAVAEHGVLQSPEAFFIDSHFLLPTKVAFLSLGGKKCLDKTSHDMEVSWNSGASKSSILLQWHFPL